MDNPRPQPAWSSLDALLNSGALGNLPDGELLDRFRAEGDSSGQEAFRILVERHGAMVLGLCRSLVSDPHEAEDAFQATFLVLVRRAGSIRRRETIAPWLYGVARRVARRAQARVSRRRQREVAADVDLPDRKSPPADSPGSEQAVHDEIARLPESLRASLVLCCLEGQSYDLAARRLGLREPTLRGRLARARKTLESRLRRRGILAPIAARLAEPGGLLPPAVSSSLVESTTQLAARWVTLSGLVLRTAVVPPSIAALAQGVLHTMLLHSIKVGVLVTLVSVGVVGTFVVAQQEGGAAKPAAPAGQEGKAEPVQKAQEKAARAPVQQADLDAKTRQILQKLDQKIDLKIDRDVTLDRFLKAIKQATTDKTFSGIPIYVDPLGLQEARVSLIQEVQLLYPAAELGFILRETLRPWHLAYYVKDGFLMITSREDINQQRLEELERKIDRLAETLQRIEARVSRP
ncbi:MAG: RNA polymerase sigma factor [Isosphaeraceae bacterium]